MYNTLRIRNKIEFIYNKYVYISRVYVAYTQHYFRLPIKKVQSHVYAAS